MLGSLFHPLGITQITSAAPHLPPAYLYLWGTLQISPRNFNHQYFVTSTRNGMAPNNLITELYIILSPPLTAVHRPCMWVFGTAHFGGPLMDNVSPAALDSSSGLFPSRV